MNNIKGNYNIFLESKLKDVKNTFNSLNEAVIELFDNDEEQIIYWFNDKAAKLFDIEIDKNIKTIISSHIWDSIYLKIKNNDFTKNDIEYVRSNLDTYQLEILDKFNKKYE